VELHEEYFMKQLVAALVIVLIFASCAIQEDTPKEFGSIEESIAHKMSDQGSTNISGQNIADVEESSSDSSNIRYLSTIDLTNNSQTEFLENAEAGAVFLGFTIKEINCKQIFENNEWRDQSALVLFSGETEVEGYYLPHSYNLPDIFILSTSHSNANLPDINGEFSTNAFGLEDDSRILQEYIDRWAMEHSGDYLESAAADVPMFYCKVRVDSILLSGLVGSMNFRKGRVVEVVEFEFKEWYSSETPVTVNE